MPVTQGKGTLSCPGALMISVESFEFAYCRLPYELYTLEMQRKHESDRGILISLKKWLIGMQLCACIADSPRTNGLNCDWPRESDNLLTQDGHVLCIVI